MKKIIVSLALTFAVALVANAESPKKKVKALKVGDAAPAFKIKDTNGKEIDLAKLTIKGPVLVRLTCGCLGCDRELPYFQALHKAYRKEGIRLVAIFAERESNAAYFLQEQDMTRLDAVNYISHRIAKVPGHGHEGGEISGLDE